MENSMLKVDKILSEIFEVSAKDVSESLLSENTEVITQLPENLAISEADIANVTLSESTMEAIKHIVAKTEELKSFLQ